MCGRGGEEISTVFFWGVQINVIPLLVLFMYWANVKLYTCIYLPVLYHLMHNSFMEHISFQCIDNVLTPKKKRHELSKGCCKYSHWEEYYWEKYWVCFCMFSLNFMWPKSTQMENPIWKNWGDCKRCLWLQKVSKHLLQSKSRGPFWVRFGDCKRCYHRPYVVLPTFSGSRISVVKANSLTQTSKLQSFFTT